MVADFSLWVAPPNFYLDTRIKVPRDVKLVVDHNIGEIHVDGVTGDIRATTRQGLITLRLPAGRSIRH